VRAPAVILCADRFLPALGLARREVYHAQTFLAITERLSSSDIDRIFVRDPLMVWETAIAYKYFRLTGQQRLLIGGGTLASTYSRQQKHRPERVVQRMTRYLDERFPGLRVKFAACWPRHSSVHFAAAPAGLPWAAALGRYLAEKVLDGRAELDGVLSVDRRFPVGSYLQSVLGAPSAYAISHGILKFIPGR
jgi:gamma-glutamylputrescine oxidase